jgi:hypothetical protein
VNEAELRRDLTAITGAGPRPTGSDLRSPLSPAEVVLGRFFFVHKGQAIQDSQRRETYEFLHATFGEYLIAWLTWQVLDDLARRQAASTLSFQADVVADDLLYALLSFTPISARRPVLDALAGMMALAPEPDRLGYAKLAVRLFQGGADRSAVRHFAEYAPRRLGVIGRQAAYSANLVLLAVVAAGTLQGSVLFGQDEPVDAWHRHTLLWRSQLGRPDFYTLVDALAVQRIRDEDERDIELGLDDGTVEVAPVDLGWTYPLPADGRGWPYYTLFDQDLPMLARMANFHCGEDTDLLQHALAPFESVLDRGLNTFGPREPGARPTSALHRLNELWLLRLRGDTVSPEERRSAYQACVQVVVEPVQPWSLAEKQAYALLVLDCLAVDSAAPLDLITSVIVTLSAAAPFDGVAESILRYLKGRPDVSDELRARLNKAGVRLRVR